MGDHLSVCTGMMRNDLHQLEKTKEYKSKRRRKDRKELTSYAAMASSNSTRRTRTQSNSNDDDEQEQGWDTTTYHNIPIEAQVSYQRKNSRLRQRMDVARQQYRLAVGKAHTEKEGEPAIEIEAKLVFLQQLECLKEEASAKCMFALSQTITNEMTRVKEGSQNRKKRNSDTSTTSTTTFATITASAVKGMTDASSATQRTTSASGTATDVLVEVALEDVDATPVASVESAEFVEPVLLTWEEEEEQRRKQVHAGVINKRHKEKEEAKHLLSDLLAANNLAKSGSGGGAAFGNAAGAGAAPSWSLPSSLAPGKNSKISSIELKHLLQHVATRNEQENPP